MRDFLTRMAERALQQGAVAQPLIAPRFAPAAALPDAAASIPEDRRVTEQTGSGPPPGGPIKGAAVETLPQRADLAPPVIGTAASIAPRSTAASVAAVNPTEALSLGREAGEAEPLGREAGQARISWEGAMPSRIVAAPAYHRDGVTPHPTLPMPEEHAAAPQMQIRSLPGPLPRPFAAPPRRAQQSGEEPTAPVIRVTIGRVDVRAQLPAAPAAPAPRRAPAAALSLEDYARERREGKR